MTTTRYWIGVAAREHVRIGIAAGFAQFSHGKRGPAARLSQGDWIIYYCSRETPGGPQPCQKFVAIGQVVDAAPVQVEQAPGFKPWRRKIAYPQANEVDIRPLIDRLSFIRNKAKWGSAFRFGFLEIGEADFTMIADAMMQPTSAPERGTAPAG